jgi:hypothetical protein
VTWIRLDFASSRFGKVTRKTPLLYSALASSAETVCGKVNDLVNGAVRAFDAMIVITFVGFLVCVHRVIDCFQS